MSGRRLVPGVARPSWRPLASPTRRATAGGAAVQLVALVAYFAAVPEVGRWVVPLGFVGGVAGSVIAPQDHGLWVEGTGGACVGLLVFLVGFVGWGGIQAANLEGVVAGRVFGVFVSTAITYAIMLLPAYAIEGVIAGLVVGKLRRTNLRALR